MWEILRNRPSAFIYALLAHGVLIAMLVFSLDWTPKPVVQGSDAPKKEIVEAVAVDPTKVEQELKKIESAEQRRQREAEQRLRELEAKAQAAARKREQEEKRAKALQRKREAEAKRLAEMKKKQEEEAKRLAEKKKKEEAERRKREEQKRLAEEERKRKMAAEAKRKQEEEKRKAAEAALQAKLAEEQAQMERAARAKRAQRLVSQYTVAIKRKVTQNWIRPPGIPAGLSCTVRVQLIPGGDVASVEVLKSSGNAVFDRSVEAAVYKAAPLPLPDDASLFEQFRQLTFVFSPK